MDPTSAFYSRPSNEFRGGGGFPIFSGSRRQRGGSIFGALKSFFLPILKNAGKHAVTEGINLAGDVARDAFTGQDVRKSIVRHGKKRALSVGKRAARDAFTSAASMIGKGSRRAPRKRLRRKTLKRRKRKRPTRSVSRKPTSRKRRTHSKVSQKRKAKRRRTITNF